MATLLIASHIVIHDRCVVQIADGVISAPWQSNVYSDYTAYNLFLLQLYRAAASPLAPFTAVSRGRGRDAAVDTSIIRSVLRVVTGTAVRQPYGTPTRIADRSAVVTQRFKHTAYRTCPHRHPGSGTKAQCRQQEHPPRGPLILSTTVSWCHLGALVGCTAARTRELPGRRIHRRRSLERR